MSENALKNIKTEILADFQIKKFCAYGFLKNLKFFEPYLLIFLLSQGISLFQIGILIAVRETIVNLFEVPSGIIADYFGRKKELYLCFGFYIISFGFFFVSSTFWLALLAMIFFGLGEAFRSGTHKAMIYTYLDVKNWQSQKAFVYGRTRSFSLMGSAISSVVGIFLILAVSGIEYIFLFSIVPYILDLLLIMSYPDFLDKTDKKAGISFSTFVKDLLKALKTNKDLGRLLGEEAMSEAAYSYSKDLIQPIMELIIVGSGMVFIASMSAEDNLKIALGVIYAVMNLLASVFSKKAYLLTDRKPAINCLRFIHMALALVFASVAVFTENYFAVMLAFLVLYVLHSLRKPIFVAEVDEHMDKSNRATVLSLSAQLKSLCLIIFAPMAGYIADNFGINIVMLALAIIFALTIPLLPKVQSV